MNDCAVPAARSAAAPLAVNRSPRPPMKAGQAGMSSRCHALASTIWPMRARGMPAADASGVHAAQAGSSHAAAGNPGASTAARRSRDRAVTVAS